MTAAQQAALDKWADIYEGYSAIEEFLQWLSAEGRWDDLGLIPLTQLLDEFFGVNRADLEAARRALLEEVQSAAQEKAPPKVIDLMAALRESLQQERWEK